MGVRRPRKLRTCLLALTAIVLSIIYVIKNYNSHEDFSGAKDFSDFNFNGATWTLNIDKYIGRSQEKKEDPYIRHAFNIHVSDELPVDRIIPDSRHHRCKTPTEILVKSVVLTSVIICFHNEARSTLLRTIASVLNRTPHHLLKEVLLIDDHSNNPFDAEQLSNLPKVRVFRNEERQGLSKSRNIGSDLASGTHLVFLDSHCEVNTGWLQPLIQETQKNPKALYSPVIDVIDQDTFEYKSSSGQLKGGFDWGLNFKWQSLSDTEKNNQSSPAEPFKSPVLPGGLFMVEKSWFLKLGKFDSDLEIWGAENIELSLRSWMCGGQVIVVPCSRVGHVFRKRHPYSFPPDGSAAIYLRNAKRVAERWLGDYREHFYSSRPKARNILINRTEDHILLKKKLHCKSFEWYLNNVYPELRPFRIDSLAFGQLRQGNLCIENRHNHRNASTVFLTECDTSFASQKWTLSKTGEVCQNGICLMANERMTNDQVFSRKCTGQMKEKWSRRRRLLVHQASGLCLESMADSRSPTSLVLSPCYRRTYTQQWDFSVELQAWGDR